MTTLALATARANRARVIAALRDETLRPEDFEWNYCRSTDCVIGLTRALGLAYGQDYACARFALGLSPFDANHIFFCLGDEDIDDERERADTVTPEMCADALEAAPYIEEAVEHRAIGMEIVRP